MGWGALCAIEKSSCRLFGRFGPLKPFGWPCIEVRWRLLPEFQGKGYAMVADAGRVGDAAQAPDWPPLKPPDHIRHQRPDLGIQHNVRVRILVGLFAVDDVELRT